MLGVDNHLPKLLKSSSSTTGKTVSRTSALHPTTAPDDGPYRDAVRLSNPSSGASDFAEGDGLSKTHRLLAQYNQPWRPRTAALGEATIHANRAAAKIHDAIIMDQANTMQPSQQRLVNLSAEMSLEAVQAMEAAFDDMLKQLQQTLAAERQLGGAAALAKDTKEVKKPMARKIKTIQKMPQRSAAKFDPDDPREVDAAHLPASRRIQQKVTELRSNPEQAYQLHRKVEHERTAASAQEAARNKIRTNYQRVNRLTLKVMEALPLPGGDPLSHDYEIRAKSPPTRPERRDFSYRTRHLRRSHSAKLPEWRKKVEEHVSLGGAPYPRTVLLTNLPLRRSARECHRQEVLVRKDECYTRSQSAREESASRHDRRVEEAAQHRKEQAERIAREQRQRCLLSIASLAVTFDDIRARVLEERVKRMELEKQRNAAIMIAHWWGRYQFKKRQITDVGFLLSLRSMMQPWVHRARGVVRKRHASVMMTFLSHLNESNQVTVALKTFRERVITIQRYWKSAIKSRAAKLNLLYLQWLRYETNLIKDRKRQDAEYESILRKELAMMHPSKRRAAALKLEMKKAADKPTVIKEKSEEIHDLDGLGLILRDEDIHAAIAASKTKQIGIPQLDEGDHEPETIEFKPQRKIKSNVPGEDGLYMNYVMLKKLGVKALRHGMTQEEAERKKREEEEEEYKNRRVPRDIKIVINHIMYKRAKLAYYRDLARYEDEMVTYSNNVPFEQTRLELFRKAGLPAVSKLKKPMKPYVRIVLNKDTLAFMHSKGVRMMQVREAEERQRQADMEALMAEASR